MKNDNLKLKIIIVIFILAVAVASIFLYKNKKLDKQAADLGQKKSVSEAKYAKGSVAFFYPAE